MIIADGHVKNIDSKAARPSESEPLLAGPSEPPPTFEESVANPAFDGLDIALIPHGGEEPPPAFAQYVAEYQIAPDGSIVSHDEHLNQDGEALYRFLLSHAGAPPGYVLRCKGHHSETHTRLVSSTDSRGQTRTRTEYYTEDVTDFDFSIDVGQLLLPSPGAREPGVVHWSVGDSEPAYRGRMVRDIGQPPHERRKARKKEVRAANRWKAERAAKGLPPWVSPDVHLQGRERDLDALERAEYGVLKSSWTLRQWADDYCASRKFLKEFQYEKVVYGWDTDALTSATRAAVLSTHYTGTTSVSFDTSASLIIVRSSNRLSRALSNRWLKVLLIITLIYPFIWLYRRFARTGGGTWAVCGGAYALKSWEDIAPSDAHLVDGVSGRRLVKTSRGVKALLGTREGEWFKQWEGTIRHAVLARRKESAPMLEPDESGWNVPALLLDGYA